MLLNDALSVSELNEALENVDADAVVPAAQSLSIARGDAQRDEQVAQAEQQVDIQQQNGYEYAQRRSGAQQVMKKVQSSKNTIYNWGRQKARMGNVSDLKENSKLISGKIDQAVLNGVDERSIMQVTEDVMRPFWIRDLLLLARKVEIDDKETIQAIAAINRRLRIIPRSTRLTLDMWCQILLASIIDVGK